VWLWRDQSEDTSYRLECLRVLRGHTEDVLCGAFSPPNVLATGGYDSMMIVSNLESGAVRGKLLHEGRQGIHGLTRPGGHTPVSHLTFICAHDGAAPSLVISAGGDGRLRCWHLGVMQLMFVLPFAPAGGLYCGTEPISALSWSSSHCILLAADAGGHAGLWDGRKILDAADAAVAATAAKAGARTVRPMLHWRAHSCPVVNMQMACAEEPSGRPVVMTAARNGSIRLWTRQGKRIGRFGRDTWSLEELLATDEDGAVVPGVVLDSEESAACTKEPAEEAPLAAARAESAASPATAKASAAAPVARPLPPLPPRAEDAAEQMRLRACGRARHRLFASHTHTPSAFTCSTDLFLARREEAGRAQRPQLAKLPIYTIDPVPVLEQRAGRKGRIR